MEDDFSVGAVVGWATFCLFVLIALGTVGSFSCPAFNRYQTRMDAANKVLVNNIVIQQTEQLVQVEKQKADIRVAEAKGIAESQKIINATLTDRYLQHEAINAQVQMAGSPNHTQIYIPVGTNGIPLVRTVNPSGDEQVQ
jgi:hypothetical protein